MDIFWIPDLDPHNNRCGSAKLMVDRAMDPQSFFADPDPVAF